MPCDEGAEAKTNGHTFIEDDFVLEGSPFVLRPGRKRLKEGCRFVSVRFGEPPFYSSDGVLVPLGFVSDVPT